jgi:hypothetical protein
MNPREIDVKLPRGFMNVGIGTDNSLVADTNDSANWDTIKFPLPDVDGVWEIKSKTYSFDNNVATLVQRKE